VCIENSDLDMIGKMFQEGDNAADGIWDRIVAEDSNIYIL
jgi:hypothetical protein